MVEKPVKNVTPDGAADRGLGDENSVLEILFDAHMAKENAEHDTVKQCFRNLFALLDSVSEDELEAVTDAVCELCKNCEYAGFVGGMKTAIIFLKYSQCSFGITGNSRNNISQKVQIG